MPHVSDFTQGQDKIILDLVNYTNNSNLTLDQVELTNLVPQEDEQVKVTLVTKEGSGYSGSVDVFYNRLNFHTFSLIFYPEYLLIPQGEAVNISDLLPQVNAAFGVALTAEDIFDAPIEGWIGDPNEILPIELMINPDNKVYYLGTVIMLDGNDIPLSEIITSTILSGMNLPVPEEPTMYSWTRYRINDEMQQNSGYLDIGWVSDNQVAYRIDEGDPVIVPGGTNRVIEVPAGTQYLELCNLDEWPVQITNRETAAVRFQAIESFQNDGNLPLVNFSKGQFFVAVPNSIPASLTNMSSMFLDAQYFNQDISGWDVSNVNTMFMMFTGASTFNQDISGWNVSNVVNMSRMFEQTNFNQPIGIWNTASLNNANGMFSRCGFNQDISDWNVSSLQNLSGMFFQNEVFNQDLSSWDLTHLTDPMSWFNYDTDTFAWVLPRPVFGA